MMMLIATMHLMTLAKILQLIVQVLIQHKTTLKQVHKQHLILLQEVLLKHLILLQEVLLKQINKIKEEWDDKIPYHPTSFLLGKINS